MKVSAFDVATYNKVFRERVAFVYGHAFESSTLDDRQLFYLKLLAQTGCLTGGKHLVDLAPGTTAFGPIARALGMQVTLIDDYGGGGGVEVTRQEVTQQLILNFRERLGIRVEQMDFISSPLPLSDDSVDVITCFHSLEHWHHSPKPLFREICRVLKTGGYLIIATPNAVNLRKRISVPLGGTNYGTLEEWYHHGDPVYRGHVREPVVRDLQRLMEWNHLEVVATLGRNFIGRDSIALGFLPKPLVKTLAIIADHVIRMFPTLCSDIHVIGRKLVKNEL
jgi:SAM-dependent methyltransferase